MSRAVLSIGSNLGDRLGHLRSVVAAVRPGLVAVSGVYETEPFGTTEAQEDYLNAVVIAESPVDSRGWLTFARRCEASAQRVRTVRWGPRTLDVDVVAVDEVCSDDPELVLPHPRAHERAFVLVPWLDADPDAVLPGHGPVMPLLAGLDVSGVRARADLVLA